MAVVSVKEIASRRRSSNKNGVVSHVFAWLVTTDNPHDGTVVAMYAEGVPRDGDALQGDSTTLVSGVDVQPQQDSALHFIVEVTYDGNQFNSSDLHPLDRPPEYSQGGEGTQESYFIDCSKPPKPYTNSAGDTFETLGEREGGDITLTVTMNVAYWDVFQTAAVKNTTNADIVFIDGVAFGIDVLRMGVPSSAKASEVWQGQQVDYYRVSFPIRVQAEGHKDEPLDFGYNAIRTATKQIKGKPVDVYVKLPILDSTGLRVQKPWPLDGTGSAMPSATDTPATLTFQPYKSVSWASIGLR